MGGARLTHAPQKTCLPMPVPRVRRLDALGLHVLGDLGPGPIRPARDEPLGLRLAVDRPQAAVRSGLPRHDRPSTYRATAGKPGHHGQALTKSATGVPSGVVCPACFSASVSTRGDVHGRTVRLGRSRLKLGERRA